MITLRATDNNHQSEPQDERWEREATPVRFSMREQHIIQLKVQWKLNLKIFSCFCFAFKNTFEILSMNLNSAYGSGSPPSVIYISETFFKHYA